MSEREITPEEIEREHLAEVHQGAQAAYVAAVLGISLLMMLALIAWLGASAT
jgi:hypothetical protein